MQEKYLKQNKTNTYYIPLLFLPWLFFVVTHRLKKKKKCASALTKCALVIILSARFYERKSVQGISKIISYLYRIYYFYIYVVSDIMFIVTLVYWNASFHTDSDMPGGKVKANHASAKWLPSLNMVFRR